MVIFSKPFDRKILLELETHYFGDMVKGVVDIDERKFSDRREFQRYFRQLMKDVLEKEDW